jgi:hypothetical protein
MSNQNALIDRSLGIMSDAVFPITNPIRVQPARIARVSLCCANARMQTAKIFDNRGVRPDRGSVAKFGRRG